MILEQLYQLDIFDFKPLKNIKMTFNSETKNIFFIE